MTLYVTDELIAGGKRIPRGGEVDPALIGDAERDEMLENGRLSKTKPAELKLSNGDVVAVEAGDAGSLDTEALIAEVESRGYAVELDYDIASKPQLQAEAEARELTVKRTDGKDGELRAEDYRAALVEDDAE
jgi:hypothetical protein